jgi:alpha-tubulin suppressor-like RCC1 family protein
MKHPRSPEDDEPQEAPRNVRRRTEMTWYQTNIQSLRQQQIERLKDFGSEILSLDPNDPATPEMVYWTECNRRVRAQRKTDLVYPSLDFGGEVVGMGSNDSSLLGFEQKADENGDALESEHPPVLVPGDCIPQGQITQVCVGGSHTVVLGADGTCYSWGVSDEGALGRGDDKDQPIIGQIDIENVIQVAAGDTHTVFLDIEGRVWISGMHRHNEAGNWRYAEKANELKKGRANFTPVLVKGLDNVVKIGAGGDISAALTSDGTLYTWGLGVSGELARSKKM